jgi:hypothetical protein
VARTLRRGRPAVGGAVVVCLAVALTLLPLAATPHIGAAQAPAPVVNLTPRAADPGRTFQGLGAVSGGGNTSRLLRDYPATQRRQLLDYLFRPRYGAGLQLLKVEIGADTDSTEGAEPSIERQPGQVDCAADQDWALMHAAKARNPRIRLVALEWGAPAWLHGGFWSRDNIDYLLSWLGCARAQGLTIDYLGGWNERGYQPGWYTELGAAVARDYPRTRIIAADSFDWGIAAALRRDPAFSRAVAVVGMHHPCRPEWRVTACPSPALARALPQPLWASEESTEDLTDGAAPLARELNLNYVDGRMTAALVWSAASAFYDDLPLAGRGLVLAEQPWSGAYKVGREVWVLAQTTQFARPGWRYDDAASGRLPMGGSYITLRAPEGGRAGADWSTVVETTQAAGPQVLRLRAGPGLRGGRLHEWCTDLTSDDPAGWFVHEPDPGRVAGITAVRLAPGQLCTLTTTTGQHRGRARSPAPGPMPLPFTASTAGPPGSEPPLFFDVNGAFDLAPCAGGGGGSCITEDVTRRPIRWSTAGDGLPTTLVGDPTWDGDYTVSASVLLQDAPWVELLGRVDGARGAGVSGYALRLSANGTWRLATEAVVRPSGGTLRSTAGKTADEGGGAAVDRVLAEGRIPTAGGWHRLALRMTGTHLAVLIDGRTLAQVADAAHTDGQVGLRVGGWARAQFDALSVVPTEPALRMLPDAGLTAAASSARFEQDYDVDGRAARVLDGRPSTLWRSAGPVDPQHPATLTLRLARPQRLAALAVTPRRDGSLLGMVTGWRVETSADGRTFAAAAAGTWAPATATRLVTLPRGAPLRAVRLVITGAIGPCATVAELGLVPAGQGAPT